MDYYNILGINKTSSAEEVKKAYRKLAMKCHPDRGGDHHEFQKINEAYDILSNTEKRAAYDFHGNNAFFNNNAQTFEDIFSQASNFGYTRRHSPPESVYHSRVAISLFEAYNGVEKVLQIQTQTETKVLKINIPKGVNTGDKLRYDNIIGNSKLIIEFFVTPDSRFNRRGNDLYTDLPISILDLIVGKKVKFTTIAEKTLEVTVTPKTQPSAQLKIKGGGMPSPSGEFGDQILVIKPFTPDVIHDDIVNTIKTHAIN